MTAGLLLLLLPVSMSWAQSAPAMSGKLSLEKGKAFDLGLRTDDFLFLPSLELGWGYDSNLFYANDDAYESPTPSQFLHVVPKMVVSNLNTKNVKLDFDGSATVNYYIADSESVQDHNSLGGLVGASATFFNDGPVSLQVRERFRRALDRRNEESGQSFNQNLNRIGGGILFRPGGRSLEVKADYDFMADYFTDPAADWGDVQAHEMAVRANWKFFPFTALVLDSTWQFRDYLYEGDGYYGELTDCAPFKIRVGVNGFITKKLAVMAMLGYGNSFHDERDETAAQAKGTPDANSSFSGLLADARVSYKLSPSTLVQTGYSYDFSDSLFVNYVAYHEIFVDGQQRVANIVDLGVTAAYRYMMYSQIPYKFLNNDLGVGINGILNSGWDRRDQIVKLDATATVTISRYLAFQAMYSAEFNNAFSEASAFGTYYCQSGKKDCKDNDPTYREDIMAYTRHLLQGSFIVRY